MVQILIDLPEELNKKIKGYMLDNNITNKEVAIIKILENGKIKER